MEIYVLKNKRSTLTRVLRKAKISGKTVSLNNSSIKDPSLNPIGQCQGFAIICLLWIQTGRGSVT